MGAAPIDSPEDVLRVISRTGIPILIIEQDYDLATYLYVRLGGK